MISHTGETLAYVDRKRMEWYVGRNLASRISDREFKLNFEHAGRGVSYDVELLPRASKCVVCGTEKNLERHHVVPYCFRRSFREKYKRHNGYDVLALCVSCHDTYERTAEAEKTILKNALIDKQKWNRVVESLRIAKALYERAEMLHPNALPKMWAKLPSHLHNNTAALAGFIEEQTRIREDMDCWADKVVADLGEERVTAFWRKHFLDNARPRHLPDAWLEQHQVILVKE